MNAFNNLGQIAALLLGGLVISVFNSPVAPFYLAATVGTLSLLLGTGIVENKTEQKPIKLLELLAVGKEPQLLFASGLAVLLQIITFVTVYGFTPLATKNLGATQGQNLLLTTFSTFPLFLHPPSVVQSPVVPGLESVKPSHLVLLSWAYQPALYPLSIALIFYTCPKLREDLQEVLSFPILVSTSIQL